jgi:uncharacterized repeat protein (TIGR01451 family)
MGKRGVVLLLLIVAIIFSGAAYAQTTGSPTFDVYTSDNVAEPGEETIITTTIENEGEITGDGDDIEEATVTEARGVSAELDSGDAPVSVDSGEAQLGSVSQEQTATESFDITVDGDATPGTYQLPIELTYTYTPEVDGDDEADEVTTTETLTTEIEIDESSQFAIDGATSGVSAGESAESTIDITNTGPNNASEAVVTLDAPDSNLAITSQSTDIYIGDWGAGETQAIDFVTELDEDALPQDYTIYATVEYLDESDNERTSRQLRTAIPTSEGQDFSVDSVESDLWVGEDGEVSGEITNQGPNQVDNVVLLLSDGGGEEIDILGDIGEGPGVTLGENVEPRETQYSVGTLDSGEIAQFSFPLAVSSEAEAGPREAEVTARYRTTGGDVQTSDPLDLSVDIGEERDIFTVGSQDSETSDEGDETGTETEGTETDEPTFDPGETSTLEIAVTNDHNETLSNVRAQTFTDDPLGIAEDEVFIPEIEPGETEVLQFDLEVDEGADPQTYPVEIDFQYDDEENTDQLSETYRTPVTVTEPADDGLSWVLVVVIGIIVLLVALAWWFRDDIREQYNSLERP